MSERRIEWYRTKIDKDTLRQLTAKSDFWGLMQAVGHLALATATGYLTWYVCTNGIWLAIIPAFFLHGTVTSFIGIGAACHELSHGTVFKTRFLNDFFYALYSFLSWNNPVWFKTSHMKHHQYTLYKPDDLEVVLPQRVSRRVLLDTMIVTFEGIRYPLRKHYRAAMGRLHGEWENQIFPASNPQLRRDFFNWSRLLIIGHIALAVTFIAIGQWILIPIVLMPFYCGWLTLLCGAPQHLGLQSAVPDFRRSCRTMLLDPISRFLYWQMNFHAEHHMYAAVPFYNLGKLHRIIQADGAPKPNRGLLDAWKEIRMIQKKQAEDPTVAFDNFSRGGEPRFVPAFGDTAAKS